MSIVVGLNYGDEGKGLTTSFLCSQTHSPIVVRSNGGHQAGHTVNHKGKRHVFSSFGSGTLQGVPTYWSEYCTFYPTAFMNEHKELNNEPIFYIHPLCPITTPYDVYFNKQTEKYNQHGSVGVGFGATIQRQENYYKLFVQDLFYESVLLEKLKNISKYYKVELDIENYLRHIREAIEIIRISDINVINHYEPIFEGAQGILLDKDFGFFPNVTRSNTTTKNALTLHDCDEVFYITRSYLTRHGNGFMCKDESPVSLINNENETNVAHEYQGNFRTSKLDTELMNYALKCDSRYSKGIKKNLVITCTDQYEIDIDELLSQLNTSFNKVYISNGDSLENISIYKHNTVSISSK